MNSKTIFAIDIFVPDVSFLYRDNQKQYNIMDFIHSKTNEQLNILENSGVYIYHVDNEYPHKLMIIK